MVSLVIFIQKKGEIDMKTIQEKNLLKEKCVCGIKMNPVGFEQRSSNSGTVTLAMLQCASTACEHYHKTVEYELLEEDNN